MRNIERKAIIVLYLSDFDSVGFETPKILEDLFVDHVDTFLRIGFNQEHTSGLPRKSPLLYDEEQLKEDRQFLKESGHKGCYSLHALEPPVLLDLVSRAVSVHYDREKYPHDRVARWQKAHERLKQSLEGVLDELLELAA